MPIKFVSLVTEEPSESETEEQFEEWLTDLLIDQWLKKGRSNEVVPTRKTVN